MTHDELVIRRGNASGQTGSLPPAKAIKVHESKMTYDELLELIAANEEFYGDGTNRTPSWTALRAVVELHKPKRDWEESTEFGEQRKKVSYCSDCHDGHGERFLYPCLTIKAIEKELQ